MGPFAAVWYMSNLSEGHMEVSCGFISEEQCDFPKSKPFQKRISL